ncbi:hypothetical protein DOY81_007199 [Sarcophaga bullata]|nr:hypothetical protein DOY81_007199 [Sarcophaga bullata]
MISFKVLTFLALLLIISNGMISASVVRDSPPLCREYCTKELIPHCVTLENGTQREFPNQCTYELESCKGNIAIKEVQVGRCIPSQE